VIYICIFRNTLNYEYTSESLIGANVTAIHKPSGTFYGNSTNEEGIFRMQNMRIGGPYTITVSYTGYEDYVTEQVFLTLGQSLALNVILNETGTNLETVTVTASVSDIFDGNRTGQSTIIDENLINEVPTISRSIGDFARLNPSLSFSQK